MPAEDGVRLAPGFQPGRPRRDSGRLRFGSYTSAPTRCCFSGFIPNALLQAGLLPSLYYSMCRRASSMSARLLGGNGMRIRSPWTTAPPGGRAGRPEPGLMPVSSPDLDGHAGLGPPPLGPPPFGSTAVWVHRRLGPPLLLPPCSDSYPRTVATRRASSSMSDGLDSDDRDVDVVVVVGHPPHRVLDAEAIRLALNVGVDGIAEAMSGADRDVQGAAAGVVGAGVAAHHRWTAHLGRWR